MEDKMKKRYYAAALCLAAVFLLSITGCGGGAKNAASGEISDRAAATEEAVPAEMPQEEYAMDTAADGGAITSESGIESVALSGRKLIRTVRLEMQTKEYDELIDGIGKKIQEMNGYIENSSVWGNSYNSSGTRNSEYTVRIPSDRLDEFIQVVGELGNVVYKNEYVEDVTLQYVDVESHKKALETERDRLLELLEQAENLEDLLAIESRLSEVRYELENYGSQKRFLDNQIDYSTVSLSIMEVERITDTGEKGFFQEIAERFGNSLYMVGKGLRGFVIALIGSLPVLAVWAVVIAGLLFLIRKFLYGNTGKKERKKEKKENEPKEK